MARDRDRYDYDVLSNVLKHWWRGLHRVLDADGESISDSGKAPPPDRAALAELRRIDLIEEGGRNVVDIGHAMSVAAFRALRGKRILSAWLLLGPLPGVIGAYFTFR